MSRGHVGHSEIRKFAEERVNLPRDKANEYRAQVNQLRERLETYLSENPSFSLKKMMLSGSLAKGTALRSLNDIDLACYVSGESAPRSVSDLLNYLATRLRSAFPNFSPDQVEPQTYSVKVSFRGSGLDVDVVPIIYSGDPDWYGDLVSQDDGTFLRTCIPRHIEFVRKRKNAHQTHFAQVVRLAKYWVSNMRREHDDFRFKSFMVELVLARLADKGLDFSDYPEALQHLFTYIATTNLSEKIVFTDYYDLAAVEAFSDPVQMIDPVNEENNAARLYTRQGADVIVDAAIDAGDVIDAALLAPTKQETVRYWQRVFGPTFQV